MKRWPLAARFGFAAACLGVAALMSGLLVLRPLIFSHQLAELDALLSSNAEELFRDIENFRGAPQDFRKPVAERLIPAVLRGRYIQINGPEGQLLYRSANLRGHDLAPLKGPHATITINGRDARIGTFTHGFLTVHIGTRLGTIEAMQEDLLHATLLVAPGLAGVVFAVGWILGHRSLRPVHQLAAAAADIDATRPAARLPLLDAAPEIIRLTEVLNRSFDRLQQACASATRFSADASHQLRTPLAVLRAGLDDLRAQPDFPARSIAEIDSLLKQTRRLATLTEDLLLLAQIDAGRLRLDPLPIDLAELARAALDDAETLTAGRSLHVDADLPPSLPARGDHRRVAIILQNLAENAVKYAPAGGSVHFSAGSEDGASFVRIANSGDAIPEAHRARLFERFHRAATGENVRGHGLGLAIARALAEVMSGTVSLRRSDGQWTEFELRLPT